MLKNHTEQRSPQLSDDTRSKFGGDGKQHPYIPSLLCALRSGPCCHLPEEKMPSGIQGSLQASG